MAELFGKRDGCCGGRGGTMHLYDRSVGLFGTNGIVGGGIAMRVGVGDQREASGARTTSASPSSATARPTTAAFHEGLNFAGVQRAPAVFVCENNLYATATPLRDVTLNPEIATRAAAYGIPGVAVDGNDVLAVWTAMREAVDRARRGDGPTLIEAKTYRTVGHHEGDPVIGIYRTQEEVDAWAKRDPVATFRRKLIEDYARRRPCRSSSAIDAEIERIVEDALEFARRSPEPDPATARLHVYRRSAQPGRGARAAPDEPRRAETGLARRGARRHRRGDAAQPGTSSISAKAPASAAAPSRIPRGSGQEFGPSAWSIRRSPSWASPAPRSAPRRRACAAIADLMFADFLFEAAGQIVLQAAKLRYMSNGQMTAPMVVRVGAGAVRSAGPAPFAAPTTRSGRICRGSSSACRRRRPTPRA